MEPTSTETQETKLLNLLSSNKKEGISLFYTTFSPALFGVIRKSIKSDDVANEVLKDTFVSIWKNLPQYDKTKESLFIWCINIARETASKNSYLLHSSDIPLETDQHYIDVLSKFNLLDPEIRLTFETVFLKNFSYEKVAKTLKISESTVKLRVREGLKALEKLV